MIGPMHLAQSGTYNGFNPLFCPCHCDKDDTGGEPSQGSSTTTPINPFMRLRPVVVDSSEESELTYDTILDTVDKQDELSSKVVFKMLTRLDGVGRYPQLTEDQKIIFNEFLEREEEAFALLLLMTDEECYEC